MIEVLMNAVVKSPLPAPAVKRVIQKAARLEPKVQGRVDVTIVGKTKMQALNKRWRGFNKPTDVLSFAWSEDLTYRGDSLGEIYLCPAVLKPQAKRFKVTYKEEFTRLLIHGLLHLVGYDHDSDTKAAKMCALQERVLSLRGAKRRGNPTGLMRPNNGGIATVA